MNAQCIEIEKRLGIVFPESYKKLLGEFQSFCLLEYEGKDIDLYNAQQVFEVVNPKSGLQQWQYLQEWTKDSAFKQPETQLVARNDNRQTLPIERVANGFVFASGSDGVRIYFDVQDQMSVWEYWLDEGSVGKIANSFDEFLANAEILEQE